MSLTPEEWVRQHLIHFLVTDRKMPRGLISVEKSLLVNTLPRRTDIVVYSRHAAPVLLAECKAPDVPVSQAVFDQAARYNFSLGLKCFVLSNGLQTYCCVMDHESRQYRFLKEIPLFETLSEDGGAGL